MPKVIVFGLDGGTWNLIKPWADKGELPTFKKLMENGAWGVLESTVPPSTVPAWPSMLTGKKPEKLGFYYFTRRDKESYEPTLNRSLFDGAIWQILNNHGRQSYVINVPGTELPREDETRGVFIAGPIMNIGEITNDTRIKNLMEKTGYQRGFPERPAEASQEEDRLIEVISRAKKQFALVKELLPESWDLLFYVNFLTDWVSHIYWKYLDETHPDHEENEQLKSLIKSFYIEIDRFLDMLTGNASNLFVVSDHGFGPLYCEINLNSWLAREGFLHRRAKAKRSFYLLRLKILWLLILPERMARKSLSLLLHKPFKASFEARRREAASRKVRERGLVGFIRGKCDFVKKALKENAAYLLTVGWLLGVGFVLIGLPSLRLYRFFFYSKLNYRKSIFEEAPLLEYIDWNKTRAYSIYYMGININLKGREPLGCVEPSEYEHVREQIINQALQIKDEEGRQVIEGAYKVEEIYDNPPMISFPDIVLKFKDMKYRNRDNINLGMSRAVFEKFSDSGGHRSEGIFLAYGSGVKRGYKVDSAKIHDLAPTILHILGLPIPQNMDGRVLSEIYEEGNELALREITYQAAEVENQDQLRRRVRGLKSQGKF